MRVLILSAAILACAFARPSGLHAPILAPVAQLHGATWGDAQALAIDAQVQAQDHAQEFVDHARGLAEQAAEHYNENAREVVDTVQNLNEEAFWGVQEQKWQAVDAVKTAESQIDGAISSGATVLTNGAAIAQPAVYANSVALAQPLTTVIQPETKTIVTQELSQTHPAPLAKAYITEPIHAAAPLLRTAPIIEAGPIITSAIAPATQTIVRQSLSQTHPSPLIGQHGIQIAQPIVKYAEPLISEPALVSTVIKPETKTVVASSLSQTHGTPLVKTLVAPTFIDSAAHITGYSAPIYKSGLVASAW